MEKRYQVFVSSTFADLIDERRAVMQALLELNCIPAGMELFPASTDDQWTLIQRVIDDCDYYLVIVGGRYGSMDAQGISYTEKEYDYAVQQGMPVMGFVHRQPGEIAARKTERDPAAAAKLDAFRSKVQQRMCRFWTNADELGGAVSRSYVQILKTHPAEGWVKSRYAKTTEDLEKTNRMHEQIRLLEQEMARLRELGRHTPGNLAQGSDLVSLDYTYRDDAGNDETASLSANWDGIFSVVGKACLSLPGEYDVETAIEEWIIELTGRHVRVLPASFEKIKIQFYSLGLIRMQRISSQDRADLPVRTIVCWELTDEGRHALAGLLAEKRPLSQAANPS